MLVSKPFLQRSRARFLPVPPLIILMVIHQWFMNGQGWFMNGQGWLRSRHVARCLKRFLTDIFGQFIASCPVADFAGHWLHRAQVSLLTGEIGQIKLSHIRKKNPGAGLVRAWCGPGAGLVRAWCGPGAGLVRVPRPKPRSRPRFAEPSNGRSSD